MLKTKLLSAIKGEQSLQEEVRKGREEKEKHKEVLLEMQKQHELSIEKEKAENNVLKEKIKKLEKAIGEGQTNKAQKDLLTIQKETVKQLQKRLKL